MCTLGTAVRLEGTRMDRRTPTKTVDRPLLAEVVKGMVQFAHQGKQDLEVRRLTEQICEQVEKGDYASEALAVYNWVFVNVRYIRDIHDVEFVKWPIRTIETGAGDCDDMATLLAAMLMSIGNQCQFVLVSFDGVYPSHVYTQAVTPQGPVVLDPVASVETGIMLSKVKKRWVIPL